MFALNGRPVAEERWFESRWNITRRQVASARQSLPFLERALKPIWIRHCADSSNEWKLVKSREHDLRLFRTVIGSHAQVSNHACGKPIRVSTPSSNKSRLRRP